MCWEEISVDGVQAFGQEEHCWASQQWHPVKNRIRFQINLRVVLLLMALSCTIAAHVRISLDLRQREMRTELKLLEIEPSQTTSLAYIAQIDARIKAIHQLLGEAH